MSGDGNRNLREFTVNFGARRASRYKANVAIKKGNKVVVSWPERFKRFRRPKKLPSSAPPPPHAASIHETKWRSCHQHNTISRIAYVSSCKVPSPQTCTKKLKIALGSSEPTYILITVLVEMTAETWGEGSRDVAENSQWDINQGGVSLLNRYPDEANVRAKNSNELLA